MKLTITLIVCCGSTLIWAAGTLKQQERSILYSSIYTAAKNNPTCAEGLTASVKASRASWANSLLSKKTILIVDDRTYSSPVCKKLLVQLESQAGGRLSFSPR